MISYIHGTLKRRETDHVVVDVGGVGYEVVLPQFVMRSLDGRQEGGEVEFEIYYHVTDRQPRPTLIGFIRGYEKGFFEKIISVEGLGPLKAARALTLSVSTIAEAIESEDVELLARLPGIGERSARKIIATLRGKVAPEAMLRDEGFVAEPTASPIVDGSQLLREDGIDILVGLGHRRSEATTKIDAALNRGPFIERVEDLIREVYRGERADGQVTQQP